MGNTRSCGCLNKEMASKRRLEDLAGQRFGRLVVVSLHPIRSKSGETLWECLCDCGKETIVFAGNLKKGDTRSCGCLHRETLSKAKTTHGMRNSPEYGIWNSIKCRVLNTGDQAFKSYGGRGIKICERWLKFENFYSDMGRRPSSNHSIDRKDNNGNYEPGNCRWATRSEQSNNTRRNVMIGGLTMFEYTEKHGLIYASFQYYYRTRHMAVEEATGRAAKSYVR